MTKSNYFIVAAVAGAFALAVAPKAMALAEMQISDNIGDTTGIISDPGGVGSPTGSVNFTGAVGSWVQQNDTESTYPSLGDGTANSPYLDAGFNLKYNGGAGNVLTLEFSQNNFTDYAAMVGFLESMGGTLSGGMSLTLKTYVSTSNVDFTTTGGTVTEIDGGLNANSSPFSSAAWGTVASLSSPYSITEVLTFTGVTGQVATASGDGIVQSPDGGATAALLGFSFLGIAAIRRRVFLA
jgi:hypothetical protein